MMPGLMTHAGIARVTDRRIRATHRSRLRRVDITSVLTHSRALAAEAVSFIQDVSCPTDASYDRH
jgi:hypothetical protein